MVSLYSLGIIYHNVLRRVKTRYVISSNIDIACIVYISKNNGETTAFLNLIFKTALSVGSPEDRHKVTDCS